MNPDPLEISLDAQRPINEAPLQPLIVELLLSETQRVTRRITVRDHERFRETLEHPHKDDADLDGLICELRRERSEA